MKRKNLLLTLAAVATVVLMALLMAGCGETSEEPEPTTEAAAAHSVAGIVDELSGGQLQIYTQADEELNFNIENAEIVSEDGINPGDTATVEYTGEVVNGDTSGCQVQKVVDVAGAETTIEGVIESINSDSTVTITSNNKKYTFQKADVAAQNGKVKAGEAVKVTYAGVINGDDTSHAYVRSMSAAKNTEPTETTANAVSVKAVNETVWASTQVNVRAEASTDSEKVGTIKKGTKLTRTGVLSNGWSRVTYKDKDRFIASSYLTTKDPAKATATKATETKATETKATETKSTEEQTQEVTEEQTGEVTEEQTEEVTEEQTEEVTEEQTEKQTEEPVTLIAKGIVTDVDGRTLTLDDGTTYNIAGAQLDVTSEEALGQQVVVEYTEGSTDAVHVYLAAEEGKSIGDEQSSVGGATKIAIILALIAIAIAVVIVLLRNRRKTV